MVDVELPTAFGGGGRTTTGQADYVYEVAARCRKSVTQRPASSAEQDVWTAYTPDGIHASRSSVSKGGSAADESAAHNTGLRRRLRNCSTWVDCSLHNLTMGAPSGDAGGVDCNCDCRSH